MMMSVKSKQEGELSFWSGASVFFFASTGQVTSLPPSTRDLYLSKSALIFPGPCNHTGSLREREEGSRGVCNGCTQSPCNSTDTASAQTKPHIIYIPQIPANLSTNRTIENRCVQGATFFLSCFTFLWGAIWHSCHSLKQLNVQGKEGLHVGSEVHRCVQTEILS